MTTAFASRARRLLGGRPSDDDALMNTLGVALRLFPDAALDAPAVPLPRAGRVDVASDAVHTAAHHRLEAIAATAAADVTQEGVDVPAILRNARQRAAAMSIAASEVSRRLDEAGVRHMFFKGVVVDALFYGGRGLRGTSDIDVLVDDLANAAAALAPLSVGAAVESTRPRLITLRTTQSVPARVHGLTTMLDMQAQWLLAPPLVDDTPAVLARAVRDVDAGTGAKLPRPAHEDYAAYVGANLVMDRFSGRIKLGLDLARMFSLSRAGSIDVAWHDVVARAKRWRVSGALWALASFVERRLGVRAPDGLVEALVPKQTWRRALLRASVDGAPIPGAFTRGFETDSLRHGLAHFARYVPARIVDHFVDEP